MKVVYPILLSFCLLLGGALCHAEDTAPNTASEVVADENLPTKTIEDYQNSGINVLMPKQWIPFSSLTDSGEHVGFLVEMWKKWEAKTGVPVRLELMDWPDTVDRMKAGTADVHSGLYPSDEREEYMDFSEPLHSASGVLAVRDAASVDCSNAISAGRVGIVENSYAYDMLTTNSPESDIIPYPGSQALVDDFLGGKLDALALDYASLVVAAGGRANLERITLCRTLYYRVVSAGVRKGDKALLQLVNDGFSEISQKELEVIESHWFVTEEHEPRWKGAVLPAVGALVFVACLVFVWVTRRS